MGANTWPKARLGDVTVAVKDGTHGTHIRVPRGIPFLSAKNITDGGEVRWDESDFYITDAEYRSIHRTFQLQVDDLLLTIVGSLGRRALHDGSKVTFQRSVAYVRPDQEVITPKFLFHATATEDYQRQLVRRSNATAQAGLYLGELEQTGVPLPPLPEQRRISAILDTLDEAIRRTEQVIEKLKEVKQGLLHDLLTRGIDAEGNGELRPPPDEAPHLYKDSPLGRIPRGWEALKLADVVPRAEYGISSSLDDRGEVPVLRMNNLRDGEADLAELKFSDAPEARALLLRPGDVLFNRTNSIDHVGRTGIWRGQLPVASFASYLVRLVNDPTRLTSEYLNRWLNLPATQIRIRQYATPGVHQVNINPTNLRKTSLALPSSTDEQEAIGSILFDLDGGIERESGLLNKLRTLKNGLMDDLLTGRVRVNTSKGERT